MYLSLRLWYSLWQHFDNEQPQNIIQLKQGHQKISIIPARLSCRPPESLLLDDDPPLLLCTGTNGATGFIILSTLK